MKNMVLKNAFYLSGSEFLSKAFFFISLYFMARAYGPEGIGKYSFAFTYGSIFMIFANWGLNNLIIRELNDIKDRSRYLGNIFSLKLIFGLLFMGTSVLLALIILEKDMFILILFTAAILLTDNLTSIFYSIFRYQENMLPEATIKIFHNILIVSLSLYNILSGNELIYIFISFFIGKLFAFFVSFLIFSLKSRMFIPELNKQIIKKILIKGLPFMLISLSGLIIYRVDILMLKFLKGYEIVGLYEAAYNIIRNIDSLMLFFSVSFYSRLCKIKDIKKSFVFLKKSFMQYFVFILFFILGILLFGNKIILFIYGPDFLISVKILYLISFGAIFLFLNKLNIHFINSINKPWINVLLILAGAILNIILNLLLIPSLGWMGAAISSITSYMLIFGVYVKIIFSQSYKKS
ncbi:MAG: oligosaccharide flippase family protein [Candidatus Woesearchaeota archaeon]